MIVQSDYSPFKFSLNTPNASQQILICSLSKRGHADWEQKVGCSEGEGKGVVVYCDGKERERGGL